MIQFAELLNLCSSRFRETTYYSTLKNYRPLESKLSFDDRSAIVECVESTFGPLFERLRACSPSLSESDLVFCALCSQNFDSSAIAECLTISRETVRVRKHRLRDKLEQECYDLIFVDSKCNAAETANAGLPQTAAITLQQQPTKNANVMSKTMRFKAHVAVCLRKYFDMRGRADHSEYWDFFLFYYLVILGMAFIRKVILGHVCPFWGDGVSHFLTVLLGVADWAVLLALIPPCYAVTVRRLNALGYEAWLAIPIFVPLTFLYLHFKYVYYCIGAKCLAEYNADPWYNILLLKPIVDPYKVLLLTLLIQYLVFDKKDDISNTSDVETK